MGLFRQILPYLFVLFFIIKGNKQVLFLLGIPFLMFMSNSIFFENAKPFQLPGRLTDVLGFIWLVFLWLFSKTIKKPKFKTVTTKSKLNATDFCVIGLIIISFFGLGRTFIDYYPTLTGIMQEFFVETSLFFSYFIIKNWISSNELEVVIEFLYSLVIINTIASLLFILHQGLQFNIYTAEEYLSESFQGQQITRSFFFMPQFLFFSVAFLLVFKNRHPSFSIVLLIINLLAIIITYTISAIMITVLIIGLYFILTGLKEGKLGSNLGNLLKYGIIAFAGFFILSKLLPTNMNYLMSRISEQTQSNYTTKDENDMDVRLSNTELMISKIDYNKKIFGMGPTTEVQSSKVTEMKANTADTAWSGVIFYWGFMGLFLFVLIYLFSSLNAFKLFIKLNGVASDLALMLLIYILAEFVESFVSWTFLSGHGVAVGLWYFAILSVLPKINNIRKAVKDKDTIVRFIPSNF